MHIEKNERVSIQENFLAEEKFNILAEALTNQFFPWYYNPTITTGDDVESTPGHFYHIIYQSNVPNSPFYESQLYPILKTLGISIISRIQINLNYRLPQPYISKFHTDSDQKEKMTAGWITSILYINTNNGYTELETGEKIESVENRLVSFPANIEHRGVTQTDEQTRILINFNYLKRH